MRRRDALLLLAAAPALPPFLVAPLAARAESLPRQAAASWPAALRLAERVRALDADGLDPAAYGLPTEAAIATDPQAAYSAIFRAAAAGMSDLLHGRVRVPPAGRVDIARDTAAVPLAPWIDQLAQAAEPAEVMERAALASPDTLPLRAALAEARAVVDRGGWASIPGTATIEPGSFDPVRIPALRARLQAEDPILAATPDEGASYGPNLLAAVRRWQAARGFEVDGRVGRISLTALNRPAEWRMNQLLAAMDMRRAAAARPSGRHIAVNIPDFHFKLFEGGQVALEMAVIVGRPGRPTPMLNATMTAVQFNPPWGVPMRNAREDLLPRLRRNPAAVAAQGFHFFRSVAGEMVEIDPTTVAWSAVDPQHFPYIIRQEAGDSSALGRIKFIMPNRDDIYLHDTPDRHYFNRPDRAFSSGCIRLARPLDLLAIALEGTPGWDRDRAIRAIDSRATSVTSLHRPIPVRLHYNTVVVEHGRVRMRPDIYGLDQAYAALLAAAPPRLASRG